MATLVNIDLSRGDEFHRRGSIQDLSSLVNNLQTTPPKGYKELVDAISEFWYTVGTKTTCGMCFAGEIRDGALKGRGCCGYCPHLSSEGCVAKPIACAIFGCEVTRSLIPLPLRERFEKLYHATSYYKINGEHWSGYHYYYDAGYREDMKRPRSEDMLSRYRKLTRRWKALTKAYLKLQYTPNWSYLLRKFQAKPEAIQKVLNALNQAQGTQPTVGNGRRRAAANTAAA